LRAEIIVRCEKMGATSEGEQLAMQMLDDPQWAAEHRYLIADALGRAQLYAARTEAAFATLQSALEAAASGSSFVDPLELATTLRGAAVAAVRLRLEIAGHFASEAVRVIRQEASLPEAELIRNLGEAALVAYLARDTKAAYAYLSEATDRCLRARATEGSDKLLAALGRVVEHTYHLAKTGGPPDPSKLGVEFPEPEPDIFYQKTTGAITPELSAIVCIRLGTISDYLGHDDAAVSWAERACAEAYENPSAEMSKYLFVALQYLTLSEADDALSIFCRELGAAAGVYPFRGPRSWFSG
jgi:hypothetical protein